MFGNSTPVVSRQSGPHPRLSEIVQRQRIAQWRAPCEEPVWWAALQQWWRSGAAPILDLGCGCGESVQRLGQRHPGQRVLGVDVSLHRLRRGGHPLLEGGYELQPERGWLHGDAALLLRLLTAAQWRSPLVCLYYPNPWPKAAQMRRRWHGHPAFVDLLRVADALELRSNWSIYVQEFAQGLEICGWDSAIDSLESTAPLSHFERKYVASGHRLWRLTARAPTAIAQAHGPQDQGRANQQITRPK